MILLARRIKIALSVAALVLCASVAALLFKKEIRITYHRNRIFKGEGNCWPAFRQEITNALGNRCWWTGAILETNRLAITAPPEDMPKWAKLIFDFDR